MTEHQIFKDFAHTIQDIFGVSGIMEYVRGTDSSNESFIDLQYEDTSFKFGFSKQLSFDDKFFTDKKFNNSTVPSPPVFLPSHEFLSINRGFISTYTKREIPYNETYYDLSLALDALPLRQGKLMDVKKFIVLLEEIIIGASLEEDIIIRKNGEFYFNLPEGELNVHLVSEGYRKIGTLLYLLKNGSLTIDSILLWDEPEANLNPKIIVDVVKILKEFALSGMQIFITTHDFLLSHELSLLAEYPSHDKAVDIKFFALNKLDRTSGVIIESGQTLAEIENNPILEEFAAHYDRETELFSSVE